MTEADKNVKPFEIEGASDKKLSTSGNNKKSVFSNMKESKSAEEKYSYKVVPSFYETSVS